MVPEHLVGGLIYSNLVKLKQDMAPEPDLAESWSSNPELTEWTFKLRPGVRFHDGSPCTAKDVAASFEAMLNPKMASTARTALGALKEVVVVDDTTVVMKLGAPSADFPVAVAYTTARIIPEAIAKGDYARLSREGIGTGPFKLVSFEPDRLVVVERNPNYFIPDQPYLARIEIRVYPDNAAETSALIAGDNDLMVTVSQSEFGRLSKTSGVTAIQKPSGRFLNVNMRCDQKPFDDVRVRKALSLAVDREALVGFIAHGLGQTGADTPLNPSYYYYKQLPLKKADMAAAKKLLAEAGYPDGLDVTLVASENPGTRAQLAIAMREMARPAGFRINVQTMPHAAYLDQVWKKGSFYVGSYAAQATADQIFSQLYTSDSAWNETRWNNADFDKLVAEARAVSDEGRRRELYARAQDLMSEQVPSVIPIFFDLLAGHRNYVKGYEHHPTGAMFRFERVWLDQGAPKRG
ncbi:ABC transporter substrate-binding protein [Bosea sp. (in: a-proteobacteria)]|uniref:ABC transporter substrate-binding protein n=1 Tax=Bosea sp. (in: a-proteobacteria) TaxID=1871050 RepID=UPI00345DA62A